MARGEDLTVAARELREFAKVGLREDSARSRLRLLERSTILRSLPAVQAAGGDSRAQFEYLAQAIVDSIDEMDGARTGSPAPAPGRATARSTRCATYSGWSTAPGAARGGCVRSWPPTRST